MDNNFVADVRLDDNDEASACGWDDFGGRNATVGPAESGGSPIASAAWPGRLCVRCAMEWMCFGATAGPRGSTSSKHVHCSTEEAPAAAHRSTQRTTP